METGNEEFESQTQSASTYPNIIFILADQMKASALKMYSEIGAYAPALQRLAGEGVRFNNGVTPHPLCVPARVSMMTSRYAHATGSRRNETPMPPGQLHAFRIWKELGYTTGLIGKNHCFVAKSDLDLLDVRCELSHNGLPREDYIGEIPGTKGMEWVVPEEVISEAHSTRDTIAANVGGFDVGFAASDHPIEGYSSRAIVHQVEEFLDQVVQGNRFDGTFNNADRYTPFALQVSFPDPHHPNEVPRDFFESVPSESIVLPPTREDEFEGPEVPERNRVLYEILRLDNNTEEEIRDIVSTYLAMVRFVDEGVGRILNKLDDLGLRNDTIIVFTADHGDFAGEHNMFGKGGVYYDCLVRVPYIVSWTGGGVPQGIVDDNPVNTIDILPTILQLSGVADFLTQTGGLYQDEIPAAGPKLTIDTVSPWLQPEMLRRLQGFPLPAVTGAGDRVATYSEYGSGGMAFTMDMLNRLSQKNGSSAVLDSLWAREAEGRRKMVRTRIWKYVTDTGYGRGINDGSISRNQDELYDLKNDPWELNNVAGDPRHAEVISEMRALLLDWMLETEDYNPVVLPRTIGRS